MTITLNISHNCMFAHKENKPCIFSQNTCFLIANCQCQYYIYVFLNFYKDHYNVVGEYSSHYTISCEFNYLSQRCCWTALWWFYWSRTCVSLRGECTPQVSWGLHIPLLQTQWDTLYVFFFKGNTQASHTPVIPEASLVFSDEMTIKQCSGLPEFKPHNPH